MKVNGNELKPGNVIQHKNRLWSVVKAEHVKPGKGGAFAQVELKDIIDGTKLNERFRSSETVEKVRLDEMDGQFLYAEGDMLTFMDTSTFEQISLPASFLGDKAPFLKDGMLLKLEAFESKIVSAALPDHVVLEVKETEPSIKGQTVSGSFKPAILENGIRVMVPTFIANSEKIVVDTRDVSYVRRAD